MELYIEKSTAGKYGLIDTFINESVSLNTKTLYTQDITAVFKGFTNSFSVQASPNNVKLLGYFGFTEQLQPTAIEKRAKLYLDGMLFKEGVITLENASWINGTPSLFQLSFSDGQKNLTELLGEDTLAMLGNVDGNISWTTKNIQNGLQSIQTGSGGVRWFVPLVSTNRIVTIDSRPEALPTDNIYYDASKPITSENVLLPLELRPAMFMSEILKQINKKYDIKIDPTPYVNDVTQLTDLCTMCVSANVSVKEVKAKVEKSVWDYDAFREERFDIIQKPSINAFELNYLGYGGGSKHDAAFGMYIQLAKTKSTLFAISGIPFITYGTPANSSYVNNIEVWEVFENGEKKKKLNYAIEGVDSLTSTLKLNIGLDVFTPEGGNVPSELIKPLISIFISADSLSEWKFTNIYFDWSNANWKKLILNNVQPQTSPTTVNLFESLPEMKTIDFVKSIYTMFGYKKFKDRVLNEFYYTQKTISTIEHHGIREENDLTPYADLSKLTKKTNTKYDGYDLKHATSSYQQNLAFALANGMEWGQLKFPITGKPKSEFKIETKFTAPVFNPILSNADTNVYTFYPFGTTAKLNETETRYIYDTIIKEFPIFYYNEVVGISTPYAFVDTDLKQLKSIGIYHKISYRSNRIFTGASNYISSLFNIVTGDFIDQNTLYVQDYKGYIEDTLSGKKLIHTIDLSLPNIQIQKFEDSQEIIIKETKYTVMESNISLTDGKTKLTLLNK
jgi:hypothetical protein